MYDIIDEPAATIKFKNMRMGNLFILFSIILLSMFTALLNPHSIYYSIFGSLILAPIIVIFLSKQRLNSRVQNGTKVVNIWFWLTIFVSAGLLFLLSSDQIDYNRSALSSLFLGYTISSLLFWAWSMLPFILIIESYTFQDYLTLNIIQKHLFIGEYSRKIKIDKGSTVELSKGGSNIFTEDFNFHILKYYYNNNLLSIPLIPFNVKGITLSAKMKYIFHESGCPIIISKNLLNSSNIFIKLQTPSVMKKKQSNISIISIEEIDKISKDPNFQRLRMTSLSRLLLTLSVGFIYITIIYIAIFIYSAILFVIIIKSWYELSAILMPLYLLLVYFAILFTTQGLIYPVNILIGKSEIIIQDDILIINYRLSYLPAKKIQIPLSMNPNIVESNNKLFIEFEMSKDYILRIPYAQTVNKFK